MNCICPHFYPSNKSSFAFYFYVSRSFANCQHLPHSEPPISAARCHWFVWHPPSLGVFGPADRGVKAPNLEVPPSPAHRSRAGERTEARVSHAGSWFLVSTALMKFWSYFARQLNKLSRRHVEILTPCLNQGRPLLDSKLVCSFFFVPVGNYMYTS